LFVPLRDCRLARHHDEHERRHLLRRDAGRGRQLVVEGLDFGRHTVVHLLEGLLTGHATPVAFGLVGVGFAQNGANHFDLSQAGRLDLLDQLGVDLNGHAVDQFLDFEIRHGAPPVRGLCSPIGESLIYQGVDPGCCHCDNVLRTYGIYTRRCHMFLTTKKSNTLFLTNKLLKSIVLKVDRLSSRYERQTVVLFQQRLI
jgi:hypothetical protein